MGIDIIYIADINADSESIGRIATKDLQLERSFDGNVTYFISIRRLLLQFLHMRVGSQVFIFFHHIFFFFLNSMSDKSTPKLMPGQNQIRTCKLQIFICLFVILSERWQLEHEFRKNGMVILQPSLRIHYARVLCFTECKTKEF